MSIINTIERTSFKQLFWFALIIGLALTIPLTVILVQRETKLLTKADFRPPSIPKLKRGSPPKDPTNLESVKPFLGKEGDVVFITGKNLGVYPEGAYLKIGNTTIPEDHLAGWEDDKISFYIPSQTKSGQIYINTGKHLATWSKIMTIYSSKTKTKVSMDRQSLLISNASNVNRVVYYNKDQRYEKLFPIPINAGAKPETLIEKVESTNIDWITLFNHQNVALPFYVDPNDFGF